MSIDRRGHLLGPEGQIWGQAIEKPTVLFWLIRASRFSEF
jgi:hypothetical protein